MVHCQCNERKTIEQMSVPQRSKGPHEGMEMVNSDCFVITLGESYAMSSFLDGILSWRSPIFLGQFPHFWWSNRYPNLRDASDKSGKKFSPSRVTNMDVWGSLEHRSIVQAAKYSPTGWWWMMFHDFSGYGPAGVLTFTPHTPGWDAWDDVGSSRKKPRHQQNMFSVHLVTEVGISLQVLLNQDGRKSVEFIIRNCGIHQSKWWFFLELMYLDLRKSLGIRTYNEEKLILAFWRVCGMEPMQSITNGGHIASAMGFS